ncbi:hypothetical protein QOZ80_7AG0554220 [Eleusine coracana subsp. coracana]|nr:hypothetical protein QOZ80_7AG0554220 [Eleusine coracana subsp. coracana]
MPIAMPVRCAPDRCLAMRDALGHVAEFCGLAARASPAQHVSVGACPICIVPRSSSACRPTTPRASSAPPRSAGPGAAFSARYREFHGTPPVLGFLRPWFVDFKRGLFVPTTSFRPSAASDSNKYYHVIDCRHGVVLLDDPNSDLGLSLCDPITGDQRDLPDGPEPVASTFRFAAVGLGRRGCPGGGNPVLFVAALGVNIHDEVTASACLYSLSETGEWSPPDTIQFEYVGLLGYYNRSCFIADAVYFAGEFGNVVLRYDLVRQ